MPARAVKPGLTSVGLHRRKADFSFAFGKKWKLWRTSRVFRRRRLRWWSLRVSDEVPFRKAINTARSVYPATHDGVDAADSRRCLLERHLRTRWQAFQSDAEELTGLGLAYLERLPEDEC